MMLRVLDRDRKLVTQRLLGMSETDAMLRMIAKAFSGSNSMYTH